MHMWSLNGWRATPLLALIYNNLKPNIKVLFLVYCVITRKKFLFLFLLLFFFCHLSFTNTAKFWKLLSLKWFVHCCLISEESLYNHVIHFLLSSGHFDLRGKVEDYYYLNQRGVHVTDDKDDSKDYTATKARDMQIAFN